MHASIRRLTALAALAPVFALAPASGAAASSGLKCHQSSQYGTTCIALNGSGLYLQDVLGYFAPPNRDYLSGRRWALQLTQYPCNPIHRTTSSGRTLPTAVQGSGLTAMSRSRSRSRGTGGGTVIGIGAPC